MPHDNSAADQLDPHASAPPVLRKLYKDSKSLPTADIDGHPHVLDLHALSPGKGLPEKVRLIDTVEAEKYASIFENFVNSARRANEERWKCDTAEIAPIYEHQDVPGSYLAVWLPCNSTRFC